MAVSLTVVIAGAGKSEAFNRPFFVEHGELSKLGLIKAIDVFKSPEYVDMCISALESIQVLTFKRTCGKSKVSSPLRAYTVPGPFIKVDVLYVGIFEYFICCNRNPYTATELSGRGLTKVAHLYNDLPSPIQNFRKLSGCVDYKDVCSQFLLGGFSGNAVCINRCIRGADRKYENHQKGKNFSAGGIEEITGKITLIFRSFRHAPLLAHIAFFAVFGVVTGICIC